MSELRDGTHGMLVPPNPPTPNGEKKAKTRWAAVCGLNVFLHLHLFLCHSIIIIKLLLLFLSKY